MAKHKDPTQVTIAPTAEESDFQRFVERHWKSGAVVALGIAGGILARQWLQARSTEQRSESWQRLAQVVQLEGRIQPTSPESLASMASELEGSAAAPWAKGLEVGAHVQEGSFGAATASLAELEASHPDHPLVAFPFPAGEAGAAPLPQQVRSHLQELEAWREAHGEIFRNPPLAEDAPRVRLETDEGDIVLGLDAERAPRHVENFLELVQEGFYEGTLFHRVLGGFMIQGGDPNTREGEPETWGQGGPGYTIAREDSGLKHFRYVLAAAKKPGETESSGSQFYITVGTPHHLDGEHTVFGRVVEGEEVVDAIAAGEAEGGRPKEPVAVTGAEMLEG